MYTPAESAITTNVPRTELLEAPAVGRLDGVGVAVADGVAVGVAVGVGVGVASVESGVSSLIDPEISAWVTVTPAKRRGRAMMADERSLYIAGLIYIYGKAAHLHCQHAFMFIGQSTMIEVCRNSECSFFLSLIHI
jgi:hypothetical protein